MLRLLQHENVVKVIEVFKRKSRIYIVFGYVGTIFFIYKERNLLEVLESFSDGVDPDLIKKLIF